MSMTHLKKVRKIDVRLAPLEVALERRLVGFLEDEGEDFFVMGASIERSLALIN